MEVPWRIETRLSEVKKRMGDEEAGRTCPSGAWQEALTKATHQLGWGMQEVGRHDGARVGRKPTGQRG